MNLNRLLIIVMMIATASIHANEAICLKAKFFNYTINSKAVSTAFTDSTDKQNYIGNFIPFANINFKGDKI